jgi:hypothetical protein
MAKTVSEYSIFIASPSDVAEERTKIREIVDEINRTVGRNAKIRLEVIGRETDAIPGFGADAQDVINNSMPREFDIFIGVMGHRFGKPTKR